MNVQAAYKIWSEQYDTNENKTRDLEAIALRQILASIKFNACLEIGCGTGKNTIWLEQRANTVFAVDLTQEMIEKAKAKVQTNKVEFAIADITLDWEFATTQYDLVTFSLVLEHIEKLQPIFEKLAKTVKQNGYVYIGELHPFKQYAGSKARFNTESGEQVVTCFNHHISDFANAAINNGFSIELIKEYFDDNYNANLPRILTLLLKKR
jgi:2-polyprenyl-3-methyl-5-hydroxy-6-metoxy-1,4-benzoquinol methylase